MNSLRLPDVVHDVLDGEGAAWGGLVEDLDSRLDEIGTRAVLIAGCERGVGCTTVATALAVALSEHRGDSVLLMDADFRSPGLAKSLSLRALVGLEELLADPTLWKEASISCRRPPISVLPVAKRKELQQPTDGFSPLMQELSGSFDRIVLDAGATPMVSRRWLKDSGIGAALIVVAPGAESRSQGVRLADRLDELGISVLGRIVNDAQPMPRRWDLSA